jgi:hypothetical protein
MSESDNPDRILDGIDNISNKIENIDKRLSDLEDKDKEPEKKETSFYKKRLKENFYIIPIILLGITIYFQIDLFIFDQIQAFILIKLIALISSVFTFSILGFFFIKSRKKRDISISPQVKAKLLEEKRELEKQIQKMRNQINILSTEVEIKVQISKNHWKQRQNEFDKQQRLSNESLISEIKKRKANFEDLSSTLEEEKFQTEKIEENVSTLEGKVKEISMTAREEEKVLNEEMNRKLSQLEQESNQIKEKIKNDIETFENTWEGKIKDLENQKQQELKDLEKRLKQEEERRTILEKKRKLEKQKQSLQEEYEKQTYENLDKAKEYLDSSLDQLLNLRDLLNETSQNKQTLSKIEEIIKDLEKIPVDLDRRKAQIKSKKVLLDSLTVVNNQIQSLKDSLSYHRAAPVITISRLKEDKLFSQITTTTFLCECCYMPVEEIETKEYYKWTRWGLKGLKTLFESTIAQGIPKMTQMIGKHIGTGVDSIIGASNLGENLSEKFGAHLGDEFLNAIGNKIDQKIEESSTIANNLFSMVKKNQEQIFQNENELEQEIKDLTRKINKNELSLSNAMKLSHLYVETVIKISDYEIANKYLEQKEKEISTNFSHNEQEEIRKMLKSNGDSHIYSSSLTLKNGLYLCKSCLNWLGELENETYAYNQIPNIQNLI